MQREKETHAQPGHFRHSIVRDVSSGAAACIAKRQGGIDNETLKQLYRVWQREFEKRSDPKSRQEAALIEEMRAHVKKVHAASLPDMSPAPRSALQALRMSVQRVTAQTWTLDVGCRVRNVGRCNRVTVLSVLAAA